MGPPLAKSKAEGEGEDTSKKALILELDQLEDPGSSEWDLAKLRRELKVRVADLPALVEGPMSKSRDLLRSVLNGP